MDIFYIDRKTGEKKREVVAGGKALKWIYTSRAGMSLLELIIKRKFFSTAYGWLQDMPHSRKKIKAFIDELSIDMMEAEQENSGAYKSFNEFFARKLKKEARPICIDRNILVSPADGRLLAYENIDMNHIVQVKGFTYSLRELLKDDSLARRYEKGICIVIRLCPADYHRFHFPDGGIPYEPKKIQGEYYSVNPVALNKIPELYCRNKREITIFDSEHFGKIVLMEVGATCVGSIVQTFQQGKYVQRGQEKGYFKFGGSTVIMFLERGQAKVDQDLLEHTEKGFETKVNMGENICRKV